MKPSSWSHKLHLLFHLLLILSISYNCFLYFNKIIRNIIKSNDLDKCDKYLEDYNCNISLLESVLKINKIDENKFSLSTKIKKKILNS